MVLEIGPTTLSLLSQAGGTFWLPPQASSEAAYVDRAFYFLLGVSTFFFVLIVALAAVFVIVFRRRPGRLVGEGPRHNTPLEIVWSAIPLGIVSVVFYLGFTGYMEFYAVPSTAYEIRVVAQKWSWSFEYPNGHIDSDLHVPVGEPVRLVMMSRDVIHSLFIPDFRVKMDIVPGRFTTIWFRADETFGPGEHDLVCAEYCGTGHSDMLAKVVVHKPGEFQTWLENVQKEAGLLGPVQRGRQLYVRKGCAGCHSIDGTTKVGPSFQGIFGQAHRFSNAPPQKVDDNYIRESIRDPSARIREGFQDQMTVYKEKDLSDQEIADLVDFIKGLSSQGESNAP